MGASPVPTASSSIQARQERVLRQMAHERKIEADEQSSVWGFLWTLFVFKIATIVVIIYAARGSGESWSMVLATTWYWMIIPLFGIGGPMLIKWRMLKARRRREALVRSEWDV